MTSVIISIFNYFRFTLFILLGIESIYDWNILILIKKLELLNNVIQLIKDTRNNN